MVSIGVIFIIWKYKEEGIFVFLGFNNVINVLKSEWGIGLGV